VVSCLWVRQLGGGGGGGGGGGVAMVHAPKSDETTTTGLSEIDLVYSSTQKKGKEKRNGGDSPASMLGKKGGKGGEGEEKDPKQKTGRRLHGTTARHAASLQ